MAELEREKELEIRSEVETICKRAKEASYDAGRLGTEVKDRVLCLAADALVEGGEKILSANRLDMEEARESGMPDPLKDRLRLTGERIGAMAEGLREVASLPDPIGEVLSMQKRPNGLMIGERRVPLGVVSVIYEARPNVTSDVFGLCYKTGNACILKGGSDAIRSNRAIVDILRSALEKGGSDPDLLQVITSTDHKAADVLMHEKAYIDLLIPRGGAGLIRYVSDHATVPVIETGTGNCHVYVDSPSDFDMALSIIENAKTQRYGVCNAMESLVVHSAIAGDFLPLLEERLSPHQVELRADERACPSLKKAKEADETDFGKEYLGPVLSIKTVDSLDEAIRHINRYNTGHSETIVTKDYAHAMEFLDRVDSACVYVNASTRFTDGHEFGFGAEIGISTQKLHARGPMGLKALTTTKYLILGNGQVRK